MDNKPRRPPPPATPLTFPRHEPRALASYGGNAEHDLVKLFQPVRPNVPLTPLHVSALNLHVNRDVPFAQLFPEQRLPTPLWQQGARDGEQQIAGFSVDPRVLNNGLPGPTYESYSSFVKELLFDNEDIFYTIERRKPQQTRKHVRIVHFRRFYQELHVAAGYWDTSLDDTPPPPGSKPTASPATDTAPSDPPSSAGPTPSPTPEHTYMGRRIATGSDMPPSFQHKLLCEFIYPIIRAFGCQCDVPRSQPYLPLRNLRIPVSFTGMIYRTPRERPASDIESLEGPLMALQARAQTKFGDGEGPAAIVDILKEVGAMLLLAQHRAREGKTEVVANADKWFVTKPRWGGGTGLAVGKPLGFGSKEETLKEKKGQHGSGGEGSEERPTKKRTQGGRRARAKEHEGEGDLPKVERVGKSTLPPVSKWDRRIKYLALGKPEGECDDVSSRTVGF